MADFFNNLKLWGVDYLLINNEEPCLHHIKPDTIHDTTIMGHSMMKRPYKKNRKTLLYYHLAFGEIAHVR